MTWKGLWMVLSLKEFERFFNWNEADIRYLEMVNNTIHMDVHFVTFKQTRRTGFTMKYVDMRIRLVFRDVTLLTDDYYSSLEKILSRFKTNYLCSGARLNEDGDFVIDDCIRIRCSEVEVQELPH